MALTPDPQETQQPEWHDDLDAEKIPPPEQFQASSTTETAPDPPVQADQTQSFWHSIRQRTNRWWNIWRGPLILFFGLAILTVLCRYGYDNYSVAELRRVVRSGPPVTLPIDAQSGLVLLLEQNGVSGRVIVETDSQATWLLISKDDTTASGPSLAPDSSAVAYISQKDEGQVVIVSLVDTTRQTILASEIAKIAQSSNLDDPKLCEWSSTAWNTGSKQLAFFVCDEEKPLSIVVVVDLSTGEPELKPLTATEHNEIEKRDLKWLNETQLVVSTPAGGSQPATVQTFDAP